MHEYLQRQKQSKEDLEFPDEVDTPLESPARVRFQKYKGLKSFRTSPWDPYENLPMDYSRIFQFENFKLSHKKALESKNKDGVPVGSRVTVYVKNVPAEIKGKK